MKKIAMTSLAMVLGLSLSIAEPAGAAACIGSGCLPPVVSSAWLASHSTMPNLAVVDLRTAEEYAAGHIANSVNMPFVVPFSAWITMRDDLLLELPEPAELFSALGDSGLTRRSKVVLVTSVGEPPFPQAGANRAAVTLDFAGLTNVAVLSGGYPKWVAEGRPTTTVVPTITPTTFNGIANESAFVDIDYVHSNIGQKLIIDARDAAVYSGEVVEDWAAKPGHIPSAVSLPGPRIWNADGTYKTRSQLAVAARTVLSGHRRNEEIILYCGVGGYASSWLHVLTSVLGYTNVKMYDGSAQEWVKYYDMELT